jgi:hypothetical protein
MICRIFSFAPAFARRSITPNDDRAKGFAQAGNRYPGKCSNGGMILFRIIPLVSPM